MKIKIIDVNYRRKEDIMSLAECGFKVGDVVESSGQYRCGCISVRAIRDTELVSIGNEISIHEGEYEVIEE